MSYARTAASRAAAIAVLLLVAAPVATADTIVAPRTATAKEGTPPTVEVGLVNATSADFVVRPTVATQAACRPTADPAVVPAGTSADVTVSFPGTGCDVSRAFVLGLGTGREVAVEPPKPAPSVGPSLLAGLVAGSVAALWALGIVLVRREWLNFPRQRLARQAAIDELERRVALACRAAGVRPDPAKLPSAAVGVGWRTDLTGLTAAWSFKDSWLANVNVGAVGLVTLLGATDFLKTAFGGTPATALATMAVGTAIGALLVVLANAALKAFGSGTKVPTVLGFTVAALLAVFATAFNLGVGVHAVWGLLGATGRVLVVAAAVVAALLMLKYVAVSTREVLVTGLVASATTTTSDAEKGAWVAAGTLPGAPGPLTLTAWEVRDLVTTYGRDGAVGTAAAAPPAGPFPPEGLRGALL